MSKDRKILGITTITSPACGTFTFWPKQTASPKRKRATLKYLIQHLSKIKFYCIAQRKSSKALIQYCISQLESMEEKPP